MEKFVCEGCGNCCKKFGPKGLPLFDFEFERLKEIAKKMKLKLDIRPTEIVDLNGKKFVALYGMFNEPCPFLKENKCTIYNERFLICKQFPIFSTAQFKFAKVFGIPEFMECTKCDCKKRFFEFLGSENKSIQDIENYLKDNYSECYDACVLSNKETEKIMKKLIEEKD